ncbi:MAG: twin transmembrane helix small protein [Pseudomonadota bacterium]
MTAAGYVVTIGAAAAVTVVLALGLWNLLRAGSANTSQKLMRWRIGLQFGAVAIAMVAFYLAK